MRTGIVLLLLFLIVRTAGAQSADVELLQQKADSIKNQMTDHLNALKTLQTQHLKVTNQLNVLKRKEMIGTSLVCKVACSIKDKPDGTKRLSKLNVGEQVVVVEVLENHFKVIYENVCGFVAMSDFNETSLAGVVVQNPSPQPAVAAVSSSAPQSVPEPEIDLRRVEMVEKYGSAEGNRIANNEVWSGMTEAMLVDSCGEPDLVNEANTSWGVLKQWVYDGKWSVNIENGIVSNFSAL